MLEIIAGNDYEFNPDGIRVLKVVCDRCGAELKIVVKNPDLIYTTDYITVNCIHDETIPEVMQQEGWTRFDESFLCPRCNQEREEELENEISQYHRPKF